MQKTIVLAAPCARLADELTEQGFRVVNNAYLYQPGRAADAYLYTSYRPDTEALLSHLDHADISLGNYHDIPADHPGTIMLNITGLNSSQVIDTLRYRLARRPQL